MVKEQDLYMLNLLKVIIKVTSMVYLKNLVRHDRAFLRKYLTVFKGFLKKAPSEMFDRVACNTVSTFVEFEQVLR